MRYLLKFGFMGYAVSFFSIYLENGDYVITLLEFHNDN